MKLAASVAALLVLAFPVKPVASISSSRKAEVLIPRRPINSRIISARRDFDDHDVFLPKRTAVFEYGHGVHSTSSATVSFDSSKTYPIVSVPSFDDLLSSIHCDTVEELDTTISLKFISKEAAAVASQTWDSYHRFHLVTSHNGCNSEDALGAWRVHTMEISNGDNGVNLFAERIALHQLGSYDVSIVGHELSSGWRPQTSSYGRYDRRKTFEPTLSKDLSGTQILSLDSANLPDDLGSKIANAKLDLTCTQCTFEFDFTVDVNASVSDHNITALSVSTTVNSFNQAILLGLSLGVGPLTFSHELDMFNLPLAPLEIRDLFNIGPEVGISAGIDLDISASAQFSLGAKATIEPGAFASFDFLTTTESDEGWDSFQLQPIPLRVEGGQLNASLSANISPFIGIGITLPVNTDEPLVEVRISQEGPAIVFASNMTAAVNRQCEPVGSNDFESFGTAYQVTGDLKFATHVGIVGTLANDLPDCNDVFEHGDIQLFNHTGSSGDKPCFVVVDDGNTTTATSKNGALQTPAPTGTLMEAALAVPTFDVPKIVSYFSQNGQLPTNVNYAQLVQATTIPDSIKAPVQKAAQSQTKTSGSVDRMGLTRYSIVAYSLIIFASALVA
uniref:Gpi anchored protein n=1 Tax=Psilocybe cubensis TaxID=181762 RepID=A0A8H7XMU7_PSICU